MKQQLNTAFTPWSLRLWLVALALFVLGLVSLFIKLSYAGELYYRYGGSLLGEASLWVGMLAIATQAVYLVRVRTAKSGLAFAGSIVLGAALLSAAWFLYVITHSGV